MTSLSNAQRSPQYVAELFQEKQIAKVAVIDDADDPRSEAEFYANEKNEFWSEIELNNEAAKEEFDQLVKSTLHKEINRAKDIDDDILQLIWSKRDELKALREPVETKLFPKMLEKITMLDAFERSLVDGLGVAVLRPGTNIDVDEVLKDVSIVFMDYVLGPESTLKTSVARAESITKAIYKAFSEGGMPLIILMSSDARAPADEERFRNETGLLRGMFYFAPKGDLRNESKLLLNLGAWAKTLPMSGDIQRFVTTLAESMYPVFDEFIRGIKGLSLDDYAYIQKLSLREDGQPFGDYLLWLYNSYLGHLLFESRKAIREQQKIVDGLTQNYLPPNQSMPSDQLVKMYHTALFNMNVGEVTAHPLLAPTELATAESHCEGTQANCVVKEPASDTSLQTEPDPGIEVRGNEQASEKVEMTPQVVQETQSKIVTEAETEKDQSGRVDLSEGAVISDEESSVVQVPPSTQVQATSLMPYLHLGDLFINSSDSQLLMVINAECDLSFGPLRACDPNSTVLFVKGELQPPDVWGMATLQPRTELFEYLEKKYSIVWDVKKIFSFLHREIEPKLLASGFKRIARLRLPFALDVQRAVAANLTRIGMPVGPPIYHPILLEVWGSDAEKKPFRLIEPKEDVAFWILTKEDNTYSKRFFPTVEFAHYLKVALPIYVENLKGPLDGLLGSDDASIKKKGERLKKRIELLEKFATEYESWFLELSPVALPENNVTVLLAKTIGLRKGWTPGAQYAEAEAIMINILERPDDSRNSGTNEVSTSDPLASEEES